MSYTIKPSSHPDFYILAHFDELKYDDLFIDDELHLNENRPIYLLVDTSHMSNDLPDGFLEGITQSYVVNPSIAHIAVFIPSTLLRVVGYMVIKVTRRQDRITIHQTYEAALRTIESHIQRNPSQSKQQ